LRARQKSRVRFCDKALFPSDGVDDFETGTTDETGDGVADQSENERPLQ
jgi:hypothetical protein